MKTKLSQTEKIQFYFLLLITIALAGLVFGGILRLLDPDSGGFLAQKSPNWRLFGPKVCKMDRNGFQLEDSDWKAKYLFEKQRNQDLTDEIADKSEEMQNFAAQNDLFKNYFDFKIWALLVWYICFRPPRYFTAFLLGLWTIFGI